MELAMNYETLLVDYEEDRVILTINRLEKRNSINEQLLTDINSVFDEIEKDDQYRFVILQGQQGYFCVGMDFEQVTQSITENITTPNTHHFSANNYMRTLKRFANTPKVVIAKIDGRVLAGGMGIVAASDLVLATERSQFGLSEALWGLLPANVMPFLIRRIGFQKAYAMTLTTQNISAKQAYDIHLVDEVASDLDDALRRLLINLRRVTSTTVAEMKSFFRKMWIIDEAMENTAIEELQNLLKKPLVIDNIKNYILHQRLPWEKEELS